METRKESYQALKKFCFENFERIVLTTQNSNTTLHGFDKKNVQSIFLAQSHFLQFAFVLIVYKKLPRPQ